MFAPTSFAKAPADLLTAITLPDSTSRSIQMPVASSLTPAYSDAIVTLRLQINGHFRQYLMKLGRRTYVLAAHFLNSIRHLGCLARPCANTHHHDRRRRLWQRHERGHVGPCCKRAWL
ncbi:hypothetical protein BQ8794_50286 [Mesorhizobium prunaredense]|uniref:Uncharacterized protein n=1 Tax=Mesorhizobium prunaredense TaxID=1631249 RepID=A0A1R3VED8_9HYPH|nr:hypothetical protein BQ8794_50286 [Mesorhizobium prunaredense]